MHQMQWKEHTKWSSPSLPYPTDDGIDESVILPQLRQQALLIPWKENNIWDRLGLQVQNFVE